MRDTVFFRWWSQCIGLSYSQSMPKLQNTELCDNKLPNCSSTSDRPNSIALNFNTEYI